jgi:hypothetical protein
MLGWPLKNRHLKSCGDVRRQGDKFPSVPATPVQGLFDIAMRRAMNFQYIEFVFPYHFSSPHSHSLNRTRIAAPVQHGRNRRLDTTKYSESFSPAVRRKAAHSCGLSSPARQYRKASTRAARNGIAPAG